MQWISNPSSVGSSPTGRTVNFGLEEGIVMTTIDDIKCWLKNCKDNPNCTHMLVVCDTYDWEDYPVNVLKTDSVENKIEHYTNASMQKVMEVYNMSMDLDKQLSEHRSWNI